MRVLVVICWFCAEPVPDALLGEFGEDRQFCSEECFADYWDDGFSPADYA
jgi:hypothetical protein